jgi:NAD(P)H-hydrate epimerase
MKLFSAAGMRALEQAAIAAGLPGVELMVRAGAAMVEAAGRLPGGPWAGRPVVVLCGRGNNGGDGYVAARHLALRGLKPTVFLFTRPDELRGDAKTNFDILAQTGVPIISIEQPSHLAAVEQRCREAAVVIDALLGTGAQGEVRELMAAAIRIANASGVPILAVDIPSGLDANTGEVLGVCIEATVTVTFVAPKVGFFCGEGPAKVGHVVVADIGLPREFYAGLT